MSGCSNREGDHAHLSSPVYGGGAEQAKRREAEGVLAFAPSGPLGHLPRKRGRKETGGAP
jgi:hypothetical protein